jgi:hypothetical protein
LCCQPASRAGGAHWHSADVALQKSDAPCGFSAGSSSAPVIDQLATLFVKRALASSPD